MYKSLVIISGDRVNLYSQKFSIGALEGGLKNSFLIGMPSLVAHDSHRPIGWTYSLCLHFEPGHTRLAGLYILPDKDGEYDAITKAYKAFLARRISEETKPHIADLKTRVASLLTGNETPLSPRCTALVGKELAVKASPEIFSKRDPKHGLIPLSALTPVAPGIYAHNGLLLFAHQYFRRSLSRLNSLNEPFLTALQSLTAEKDLEVKVKLDEDMVGLPGTLQEHFELQYWWGPKFSSDIKTISDGVTCHEAGERDRRINGISRTEFGWYSLKNARTFECEELCDIPSFGVSEDKFGCRFIHSQLDNRGELPVHIDGAIRMYNEERMLQRLATDLRRTGRDTEYTKLWRVDGTLTVEKWKELITHYYRDNRLPGEYFGGIDENKMLMRERTSGAGSIQERLCTDIKPGQGVRVSVSYHPIHNDFPLGRSLQTFDTVTHGTNTFRYFEGDCIEFVKAIRRSGQRIILPEDIRWLTFEDMVINLPLIMHRGEDSFKDLKISQLALLELCRTWVKRKDDRLISYTLGVAYEDREVWCSVAGHVTDVVYWLEGANPNLPESESEIREWCERIGAQLSTDFPNANDSPPLDQMLKTTGILRFERTFLDPKDCTLHVDEGTGSLICGISKTIHPEILSSLQKHEISAGIALDADSECSKCHHNYRACLCSKYLDAGVQQTMKNIKPLGVFLTNRKA